MNKLIIRADGNSQMGLGHLVRSLALAGMLKPDFAITFLVREPVSLPREQFLGVCDTLLSLPAPDDDLAEARMLAENQVQPGDVVVLDGYHFTTAYQRVLRDAGAKVVCIDDLHSTHFVADVIINHAGGVTEADYSCEPYTRCLLGMQYALLRPPFIRAMSLAPDSDAHGIFICMGGADPFGCTEPISKHCMDLFPELPLQIVIGAAFQDREKLETLAARYPKVQIHQGLSAAEMVDLMRSCQLAICPASTVSLEVLAAGVPLIVGVSADNQQDLYAGLLESQAAIGLGWFREISFDALHRHIKSILSADGEITLSMRAARARLFEHRPPSLIRASLLKLASLQIRAANQDDTRRVFDWANDPLTRSMAFNSEPIVWENHVAWFESRIQKPRTKYYILEHHGNPVGQIRFDVDDQDVAFISYSLAPEARGKGLGSELVRMGVRQFLIEWPIPLCIAGYVLPKNPASQRIFEKLGFTKQYLPEKKSFLYELEPKHHD